MNGHVLTCREEKYFDMQRDKREDTFCDIQREKMYFFLFLHVYTFPFIIGPSFFLTERETVFVLSLHVNTFPFIIVPFFFLEVKITYARMHT